MECISEIVDETIRFHLNQGMLSELVRRVEQLETNSTIAKHEQDSTSREVIKLLFPTNVHSPCISK